MQDTVARDSLQREHAAFNVADIAKVIECLQGVGETSLAGRQSIVGGNDYQLISSLVSHICSSARRGAILIFMSGQMGDMLDFLLFSLYCAFGRHAC